MSVTSGDIAAAPTNLENKRKKKRAKKKGLRLVTAQAPAQSQSDSTTPEKERSDKKRLVENNAHVKSNQAASIKDLAGAVSKDVLGASATTGSGEPHKGSTPGSGKKKRKRKRLSGDVSLSESPSSAAGDDVTAKKTSTPGTPAMEIISSTTSGVDTSGQSSPATARTSSSSKKRKRKLSDVSVTTTPPRAAFSASASDDDSATAQSPKLRHKLPKGSKYEKATESSPKAAAASASVEMVTSSMTDDVTTSTSQSPSGAGGLEEEVELWIPNKKYKGTSNHIDTW